jgi:hypothetical protein
MNTRKKYYVLFIVASLIYIIATLVAPLTPNRFNLTTAGSHMLQIAIALPIVLIWAVAVYGAERFNSYSKSIRRHPDGRALDMIARGLTILVASYIGTSLFGRLRPWAFRDGWLPTYTIVANYLAVVFALVAFGYMYRGSVQLRRLIKAKDKGAKTAVVAVTLTAISVLYLIVLLNYDYRGSTPDATKYSSFYLPDWLILLTLALPYLIGWGLGIAAALNIGSYQRHVKGVIYQSALYRVIVGTLTVVVFSIVLQILIVFSTYFAKAGLADILLIVYLIILMYAAGFLIIASGTRKMTAIETAVGKAK